MKKMLNFRKAMLLALSVASMAVVMNSCHDSVSDVKPDGKVKLKSFRPTKEIGGSSLCVVTNISASRILDRDTIYILKGDVRVNSGATLTVESGTIIKGDKVTQGTLSIERGGKIIANGTPSQPIVFTSSADAGSRNANDWGGLNIFGKAPNNQNLNQNPEGYPSCVTPPQYGGIDEEDNSGILKYVRIEFAGIPAAVNNEKNGLTLYSVGRGTTIDHIQVSYGGDDAFEFFGGTVNTKYLVSFKNIDDDFDTDFGYSGSGQYFLGLRDPQIADISQSNGFESDNDGVGSGNTPQTSAVFSNVTLVGPYDPEGIRSVINNPSPGKRFGDGLHLRRNTGIDVYNSIITGWKLREVFVAPGVSTVALSYNATTVPFNVTGAICLSEPTSGPWVSGISNGCLAATSAICDNGDDLASLSGLDCILVWDLAFPDVTPVEGAIVLENGVDATTLHPTFSPNNTDPASSTYFRGAFRRFDDNGWNLAGGWLEFDPQNIPYN